MNLIFSFSLPVSKVISLGRKVVYVPLKVLLIENVYLRLIAKLQILRSANFPLDCREKFCSTQYPRFTSRRFSSFSRFVEELAQGFVLGSSLA